MRRARPLALCALLASCAGPGLEQRAHAIDAEVQSAKQGGGLQCAPRELAVAEANLRFAQLELDQGDASRAEEHLTAAQVASQRALALSKECNKVQVTIKEKPKEAPAAPVKVALKDSDGDGVPDIDDLCPDVPGPAENHGCPLSGDRDGDGIPDLIDRCPDQPGPKENQGCPWADRDGDGVPDKDDRCPDQPGPKENQGCPDKDTDGDGVVDRLDLCPTVAGPAENGGCPWADRDGDGVPDKDDKCPDEPGPADNQGCPRKQTLVIVRRDRIELKQQVRFATNKALILKDSFELLAQVAQAMKDAPAVQIRIEGHTDSVGKADENLKLSQARASAVRSYLIAQGVQPAQVVAEGYGSTRPIASNLTRVGKAANRRVEFRMVESKGDKSAKPDPGPGPGK
jgi:outer membrane protein OmpA-like peptidoglycan-associated protein